MSKFITMNEIERAVEAIQTRIDITPEIGMVFGSA
jgi:hypothetical protein